MPKHNCNHERAGAASSALDAYLRAKDIEGLVSFDEALIDLLTDLRHFSVLRGLDFDSAVRISEFHFEEEALTTTPVADIRQALRRLLDYLYEDELRHYEACDATEREGHIIKELHRIAAWLDQPEK
jgi:hypothetical protein